MTDSLCVSLPVPLLLPPSSDVDGIILIEPGDERVSVCRRCIFNSCGHIFASVQSACSGFGTLLLAHSQTSIDFVCHTQDTLKGYYIKTTAVHKVYHMRSTVQNIVEDPNSSARCISRRPLVLLLSLLCCTAGFLQEP